jgi:hypothetical protein
MKRIVIIIAALAMFTLVASAQADITLSGTAEGITTLAPDGSFKMSGTYTDPSVPQGFGLYTGSYTELTTGYTSCSDPLGFFCFYNPDDIRSHCNIISGQITFHSGLKLVTVFFGSPLHVLPVVCQLPGTTERLLSLPLFNQWNAPLEPSGRGYGPLAMAHGEMDGTSIPLRMNTYADTFNFFSLTLIPAS